MTLSLYLSLPANNPATGEPAITGTAQVGQELTADASPILDTNGLTDVDFTYQWLRVDADGTSDEEDISGEIATYTLTDADVGKQGQGEFHRRASGVEIRTIRRRHGDGVDRRGHGNGGSLVLTYGEALDPGSVPVAGDFGVRGRTDGGGSTAVSGNTVTLTLATRSPLARPSPLATRCRAGRLPARRCRSLPATTLTALTSQRGHKQLPVERYRGAGADRQRWTRERYFTYQSGLRVGAGGG